MKKTRHGTSNFKALIPFVEVADANGGYAKFTADGFMDLVLEKLYYTDYEATLFTASPTMAYRTATSWRILR